MIFYPGYQHNDYQERWLSLASIGLTQPSSDDHSSETILALLSTPLTIPHKRALVHTPCLGTIEIFSSDEDTTLLLTSYKSSPIKMFSSKFSTDFVHIMAWKHRNLINKTIVNSFKSGFELCNWNSLTLNSLVLIKKSIKAFITWDFLVPAISPKYIFSCSLLRNEEWIVIIPNAFFVLYSGESLGSFPAGLMSSIKNLFLSHRTQHICQAGWTLSVSFLVIKIPPPNVRCWLQRKTAKICKKSTLSWYTEYGFWSMENPMRPTCFFGGNTEKCFVIV